MVKQSTNKKSAPVKKKAAPKKKAAAKKRAPKRKAPAKKRVSKRISPKTNAKSRKSSSTKRGSSASSKKKSAPKRKAAARKSLSLHKDGTEEFTTSDELFNDVTNHGGRPTKYTKTIAKKICLLISMGYSLTKICSYSDMPVMSTVCLWLKDKDEKEEFSEWYSRAREVQVDIVEDRVMDICMNVPKVPLTVGKDGDVLWMDGERIMVNHPANVALAKLQTDSHYKYLASLRAKIWGRDADLGDGVSGLLALMDEAAARVAGYKKTEPVTIEAETGEIIEA